MKWKKISIETIASLLIVLFIYTGLNKLMDISNSTFQIGRSPYLASWVHWIAIPLPVAELLIALTLIFPRTRLVGLYASFLLMFLFTGYVWMMLHLSYYLPCTCGGILEKLSWKGHLVFNSAFTVLSWMGAYLQLKTGHSAISKNPKEANITTIQKIEYNT